jgi:hypothetical protein
MGNRRIARLFFVPPIKFGVAVQTSQDEVEKRGRKMFPDPSEKTLRVVAIDFLRDHELLQKDSNLFLGEVLFLNPRVVNSAARFFSHPGTIGDIRPEQHFNRLTFVRAMPSDPLNSGERQVTDYLSRVPRQRLQNRDVFNQWRIQVRTVRDGICGPISERMEIAIQECNSQDIPVPPPFYRAKREVEAKEANENPQPPEEEWRFPNPKMSARQME